MNGIISETPSRSPSSQPKMVSALVMGVGLFVGFASGLTVSSQAVQRLNPFRTETIHYDKISWLSDAAPQGLKTALLEREWVTAPTPNLIFVPYEMKPLNVKRYRVSGLRPGHKNFQKLDRVVQSIVEATRYNPYDDYRVAVTRIRGEFATVMNDPAAPAPIARLSSPGSDSIAMTSSSAMVAAEVGQPGESLPSTALITPAAASSPDTALPTAAAAPAQENAEVVEALPVVHATPVEKAQKAKPGQTVASKVNATEGQDSEDEEDSQTLAAMGTSAPTAAPTVKTVKPVEVIDTTAVNVSPHEKPVVTTQDLAIQAPATPLKATSVKSAAADDAIAAEDDIPQVNTIALSQAEQKKLTDQLLSLQLANQKLSTSPAVEYAKRETVANPPPAAVVAPEEEEEEVKSTTSSAAPAAAKANVEAAAVTPTTCKNLNTHQFISTSGSESTDKATQLCVDGVRWISTANANSNWVKVSSASDSFFTTMTRHPEANGGATLLLDKNALGLISIKAGIHVTKGMGIIVGRVPEGYKVSFLGRAEEPEYFESTGKRYFAILNAEPGAGVIAIESKTSPNVSSTVFTPVLEDTISYLDLAAPESKSIVVKVVKSGTKNDPEVAKLTVGLSTQNGIQAITQADGTATLKGVNLIPGFPTFIDVSSRTGDQDGYTYRYELKNPNPAGVYVVNQVGEKSIHHWLGQVSQGLSDQSAMVMGIYDRKKLDGFKKLHFSKVEPLTEKFGLDPMNFTILWDGKISATDPLEGDLPRFMSVQVPEGLSQVKLLDESNQMVSSDLIPISPRVIHVITE